MSGIKSAIKNKFSLTANFSAAILLTCGLAACNNKSGSVDDLINQAKQYQQKGDDAAAQIQLKNALQKNPDSVDARFLLGNIDLESGDALSAENEFRKALSLGMSPDKVLPGLAQALLRQGQYQKVLNETDKIATHEDIIALRGNAYLGLNKPQEAKAAFESGLKSNPDSPVALVGLAKSALLSGDIPTATRLTDQAAAKNPKNIDVLLFKVNLLRGQGLVDPALTVLKQILAIKPDSIEALLNKADVEIRSQKFADAKTDIDAAAKIAPKNLLVTYMQSLLEFGQGKYKESLADIEKVLHGAPDYMPAVLLGGTIQFHLGSMKEAEQYLTRYLDKNPDTLYARKLFASILIKSGQINRAATVLDSALKAVPQDTDLLGMAGEVAMQSKNFAKATEYFEKASTLQPQSANFHTALGLSNLGQGQNAVGISQLEKATNLDATSPKAGVLLAMTHLRLKEYDKALAAANALEKEQPNNPLVQNLKGAAYIGKNDVRDARAAYEKALTMDPNYFAATASLAKLDVNDNKPEAAKKRFMDLLDRDKKNLQAMSALASLAMLQKNSAEATKWLERASSENPDSMLASVQLAAQYFQTGEKDKALTLARKLQASNPTEPTPLDLLAQVQYSTGDKTGALQNYQRLASLLPDSAEVQLKIASTQASLKDIPSAKESVRKALSLQPDFVQAKLFQASLLMHNGDPDQAVAIAKDMQKIPAQAVTGYELEGDTQLFLQKPDLAIAAYKQALAINRQNPGIFVKLTGTLSKTGRSSEIDPLLAQWFKDRPNDSAMHLYLGDSFLAQKQNKAAIAQYEALLKLTPKNAGALNNLAWAYEKEHDPRALATAEKANQAAPDSPAVMDTLGWMLVEQGNTARGVPLLQKASAAAPDALDIRYHLVQALVKSGDKTKARTELQALLATGKPFPQSDEAKALLKTL